MKIKKITLLGQENYFTRTEGECTTYNYELILENDEKILIKDLKNCDYDEQYLYNMLMKYKMSCVEKMVDVEENIRYYFNNYEILLYFGLFFDLIARWTRVLITSPLYFSLITLTLAKSFSFLMYTYFGGILLSASTVNSATQTSDSLQLNLFIV